MGFLLTLILAAAIFAQGALAFSGKVCTALQDHAPRWFVIYRLLINILAHPLIKHAPIASITWGSKSSQGNGYRDDLYLALERDGNIVNMVGNWHRADNSTFKYIGDLVDGKHPNACYVRIGRCFYEAILYADIKGWIFPVQGPAP